MDTSKFVSFSKQYFEGIRNNPWVIFNNQEAFQYYTPLGDYPHGYVLACLMDRQVKAETAWSVPYNMAKALGKFDMKTLASVSEVEMKELFAEHSHHRRPNLMADIFFQAVQRIAQEYDGDARRIWNDRPDSKTVVGRFMAFKGSGIKISTMAVNILYREYNIPFADMKAVDISPDIHVVRIMQRLGVVESWPPNNIKKRVIEKARELNPDFPGVFDRLLWDVGVHYCHKGSPQCEDCPLNENCDKRLEFQ